MKESFFFLVVLEDGMLKLKLYNCITIETSNIYLCVVLRDIEAITENSKKKTSGIIINIVLVSCNYIKYTII